MKDCSCLFAIVGLFFIITISPNDCATPTAQSAYFPPELSNALQMGKLTIDDIKAFIHVASFMQNSNVLNIETKIPGFDVCKAIKNFGSCKVGDYYRTLLRIWVKCSKEDKMRNKDEMFKNIDSLKIPEPFKSGFKAMFDHVDSLQKVIFNGAATSTTLATTTPAPTTTAPCVCTTPATASIQFPPPDAFVEQPTDDKPTAIV